MIGYAERYCLLPGAVEAYRHACVLVDRVSHEDRDGYEVRCHELSRAVARQLTAIGIKVEVVDGSLWWANHKLDLAAWTCATRRLCPGSGPPGSAPLRLSRGDAGVRAWTCAPRCALRRR